jgi:hypothetical protein
MNVEVVRGWQKAALTAAAIAVMASQHAVSAQLPAVLSDKVTDLAGEWKRDPSRGAGGICGVSESDTIAFEIIAQPQSVAVRSNRVLGTVPLDGSSVSLGGYTVAAGTDAGWLKLTMTRPRGGGYANVMQEVYILNRDRSQLTLWRTLNTVLPDGSSGKIDCGNRAAVIYERQPNAVSK